MSNGVMTGYSVRLRFLAEAYLAAGRLDDAKRAAAQAHEVASRYGEVDHQAEALCVLADIAVAAGPDDADLPERHYRDSRALATPRGMRPLVAHCHLGLGRLFARTGRPPQARDHLTTAIAMYREMEMRLWLEKAEAALAGLR